MSIHEQSERAWNGVLAVYGVPNASGDVLSKAAALEIAEQSKGREVPGYYPGETWVITGCRVVGSETQGKIVAEVCNKDVWNALQEINE